jgi:hypothetical protein
VVKYKNKNGIELSYEGHHNDSHTQLLKEVLREAIRLGDENISQHPIDGWAKVKEFLKVNFSIDD